MDHNVNDETTRLVGSFHVCIIIKSKHSSYSMSKPPYVDVLCGQAWVRDDEPGSYHPTHDNDPSSHFSLLA